MSLKPKKYLSVAELFKSLSKIPVKSLFRDFLAHPFRWAKSRPDVHRGGVLSWKSVVSNVFVSSFEVSSFAEPAKQAQLA